MTEKEFSDKLLAGIQRSGVDPGFRRGDEETFTEKPLLVVRKSTQPLFPPSFLILSVTKDSIKNPNRLLGNYLQTKLWRSVTPSQFEIYLKNIKELFTREPSQRGHGVLLQHPLDFFANGARIAL
jgi:hypothetical protein